MQPSKTTTANDAPDPDDFWLPDFCSRAFVRRLTAMACLLAIFLTISESPVLWPFPWWDLAQMLGISGAVFALAFSIICRFRQRMAHWNHRTIATVSVGIILTCLVLISLLSMALLRYLGLPTLSFAPDEYTAILRHVVIVGMFAGLFLRYFVLQAQLRQRQRAALQSRLSALQARIQPHFLFNSMNIIASLIAIDPDKAEQAVEDLAALFRASLRDVLDVPLSEELTLCRRYANIEGLRLDDRLHIDWHIAPGTENVRIPPLTLQPLLENAIRHGVELSSIRCDITVSVEIIGDDIVITLRNPLADGEPRKGNQMAVGNVRERLRARFGPRARLLAEAGDGHFVTRLSYPLTS